MSYVDTNTRTFLNGGTALPMGERVYISSGVLASAGINVQEIGVTEEYIPANEYGSVRLTSASGTVRMRASEPISVGSKVYTAAGGECSDTAASTSYWIGWALEESTAADDIIEVLRGCGTNTAES